MSNMVTFKEVTLNGQKYILKFDYNGVSDLEEYFQKGIAGVLQEEQIGFRLVRAFYWAGLKWKNPGLTMERVGALLGKAMQEGDEDISTLMKPVMDALKKSGLLSMGKNENKDDDFNDFASDSPEEDKPQENDDFTDLQGDKSPNT